MENNIKEKILYEISRIDKLINDSKPLLDICKLREPDYVEITATAQILHSFYNGVESIAVLFLKNMNEKIPDDGMWHKTLMEIIFGQNSKKISFLRNDMKDEMVNYMYFRHFIRHSYSSELIWVEMEKLVINLEEVWNKIKSDFNLFIENN